MHDLPGPTSPGPEVRDRLAANLGALRRRIEAATERAGRPKGSVKLLAVTKSVGASIIEHLVELGIQDIGENRVQDAIRKAERVHARPRWHLIGHLQTNKVRKALDLFEVVHSVDSLHLAEALSSEAASRGMRLPVLLEVNVSGEPSKGGFSVDEIRRVLPRLSALPALETIGLMTMAPLSDDPESARPSFRALRCLRDELRSMALLPELSMGMSQDFEVAIEEGATWVRVGSTLFGGVNE